MSDEPQPSRRRWRHQRIAQVALFVTVPGLLLGTTSITAAYSAGWMAAPAAVECRPVVVPAPPRGSFAITVLNATGRDGVAGRVAAALEKRGFEIDATGNAPESWYVTRSAVIHHGPAGLDQALLTAAQLPGATLFADERTGTSVDVVVGLGYAGALTDAVAARDPRGSVPQVTVSRPCR